MKINFKNLSLASLILMTSACASLGGKSAALSEQISTPPQDDLQYSEVVENIKHNSKQVIRWGGEIIGIERNEGANDQVIVLEHPITEKGRPDYERYDRSAKRGRFIVELNEPLSQKQYPRNKFITVYGAIVGEKELKNAQQVPVIKAEQLVVWPSVRQYRNLRELGRPFHFSYYYRGLGFYCNPFYFHCRPTAFFPFYW